MKDILTPEQRETVERIRHEEKSRIGCGSDSSENCSELLSIIDSLQPKQYTEEELRAALHGIIQRNLILTTIDQTKLIEAGWLECARFLGALKEGK